jgi:hypothetical protein
LEIKEVAVSAGPVIKRKQNKIRENKQKYNKFRTRCGNKWTSI